MKGVRRQEQREMAAHMQSQGMDVALPDVNKFNPPNRLLCGPGPGNAHPRGECIEADVSARVWHAAFGQARR